MPILQSIGAGVTAIREFVTGVVRRPGVPDPHDITIKPGVAWSPSDVEFISSYGGGVSTLTEADRRRLETIRERSAIKAAQEVAARAAEARVAEQRKATQAKILAAERVRAMQQRLVGRRRFVKPYVAPHIIKEKKSKVKEDKFFKKIAEREVEMEQQRIYERQTPFKELYKKKDFPAIVRKGFREAGTGFISFEEKVLGKKLPSEVKVKAGEFVGETALFAGILSPIPTTAQLEKVLAKPTEVLFKGVQQKFKKGIIKTDIKFLTDKGEKGIATGFTIQTSKEGKRIVSKTIGVGQIYKHRIELPTAKVITKPTKAFVGIEKAITKQSVKTITAKVGDLTITKEIPVITQVSGGAIARFKGAKIPLKPIPKESIDRFLSGSLGFVKGKRTIIIGRTITEKTAGIYALGIVKKVPVKMPTYDIRGASQVTLKPLSIQAVQSLKTIVQAGIQKPKLPSLVPIGTRGAAPLLSPLIKLPVTKPSSPSITAAVIKAPTTLPITQLPKFKSPTKDIQIETQIPKPPRQIVSVAPRVAQIEKLLPRQKLILAQRARKEVVLGTRLISIQATKQQQRLLQRMRLSLKQKQPFIRPPISLPVTPKPPRIPIIPAFLSGARKPIGRTPKFSVFVRRFGKFEKIGTGLTLKQAQALGFGKVSRTLAATFKITGEDGFKMIGVPKGFYKKPSKKGILFIEKPRFRLSKRPEVKEIQFYKRKKKGAIF